MLQPDQVAKAAETWDRMDLQRVRDVSWLAIPFLSQSYGRALAGESPLSDFVEELLADRIGPARDGLLGAAIVCGDMSGERWYFEGRNKARFRVIHGYDVSAESLKRYVPKGIQFEPHVVDVNDIVLEPNAFHLIVGNHGLHHVYNLGGLFYQIHKGLKNDGLLVIHEWIGPEYLQIPLRNYLVSALLLYLLYPTRRARLTHEGRAKGIWQQLHPTKFDPSEACNSDELEVQLCKYFSPVRTVRYGGLCYPVFEGRGHLLAQADRWDLARIKLVLFLERILTRMGIVRPLFVSGIFEKRANVMVPSEAPHMAALRKTYWAIQRLRGRV